MSRPPAVLRGAFRALAATLPFVLAAAPTAHSADVCRVDTGATANAVVELYTSEGCSSCPPADRWLSALQRDPRVVALAFHVDYWDRLGWKDRFANAAWTERQAAQQRVNGARFNYTPQVVVDGRDRPDWPRLPTPLPGTAKATVAIALEQTGARVGAVVTPLAGAPKRLAAYWATTEQSHVSAVRAGENEGATLRHDVVVRDLRLVAAWAAGDAPRSLALDLPPGAPDPAHARFVNLVVVDADSGRPVQAAKLGC